MERQALDINSAVEKLKEMRQPEQPQEEPQEAVEPVDEGQETQQTEFGENLEAPSEEIADESSEETEQVPESEETGADSGAETYELGAEDLADIFGIEQDKIAINDDGKVSFRAKNGEEISDVTLDSLINAYQGSANLTNRSKALAESEKQIQTKLSALDQQSTEFATQAASILEALKDAFVSPYSKEEMAALREDDPAEYAARKEEIRDRERQFNQIANDALQTAKAPQQAVTEETQQLYAQYLQQEKMKVREAVKDWEKVEQDVVNYASNTGFSDQEIGQIADSRLQILLYKAMMFDKGKMEVKENLKRTIPKITRPGKSPTKAQVSLERSQKMRQKLKQSGDLRDAVELMKLRRK